ncbi:MAG: hypothetical protein E2582_05100 [Delftia sp.]|nr:hypothetical protein [Delftia sp.]
MIFNFDSTLPNALPMSGTAGALKNILKTYLVDGAGAGPVATLAVSAGIATAKYSSGHPFKAGVIAQFAGATPTALNGLKTVLSTTADSATFAATGVPDGAATGSITSKLAPAGWTELYIGTANVLALKSSAVESTGCVLRVDDAGTTNARVRGYESMSDINTGLGPMPLDSQVPGGLYWSKSSTASGTARPWRLVADGRGFYLAVAPQGTDDRHTLFFAGDIASFKSGDAWSYGLTGNVSDQTAVNWLPDGCCGWSSRNARAGMYLARSHTGIGQAVLASRNGAHHNGAAPEAYAGTAGYAFGSYPNGPNNGLMSGSLEVYAQGMRGTLPGLLHPVQDVGAAFDTGALVAGTDDYAGRTLLAVRVGTPAPSSIDRGTVFLDITGPWSR